MKHPLALCVGAARLLTGVAQEECYEAMMENWNSGQYGSVTDNGVGQEWCALHMNSFWKPNDCSM